MKKVFCIGEALIDFVAENQGSDLSKAREFTKKAGGAPANVACAISKLGGRSSFIGCIGDDPFGKYLIDIMVNCGVEVNLVQRSETFTTLAFVSIAGEQTGNFHINPLLRLSFQEILSIWVLPPPCWEESWKRRTTIFSLMALQRMPL